MRVPPPGGMRRCCEAEPWAAWILSQQSRCLVISGIGGDAGQRRVRMVVGGDLRGSGVLSHGVHVIAFLSQHSVRMAWVQVAVPRW